MGVSAAGDDAEAFALERLSHGFRISHDLTRIVPEGRLQRFLKSDGFGGDDVDERSALVSGEDIFVDRGGELLPGEDEAGTWSAQRLVGGAGDNLRVRNRRWMHASGNETGEVRHINDENGAAFIGDGAHTRKVECPRIGAAATNNDLGLFAKSGLFELVVVDGLGILADAVGDDLVKLAGEVQLVAVGEVSAVGKIETENGVTGLEY